MGLVLLYRPVACGLLPEMGLEALFGLLLLTAGLLWLCSEALNGELSVRFGLPEGLFVAFLLAALASSLLAENWFAGLRRTLLFGGYGLTAFLVLQIARGPGRRRFLLVCFLATGVALAAYALWHRVLYLPALRGWVERDPLLFRAALGTSGAGLGELKGWVGSGRAFGNFIGPNQLAGFLLLTVFPLLGLVARRIRQARPGGSPLAPAALVPVLAVVATALWLTRSNGALIAFGVGAVLFALIASHASARGTALKLAAGLVAVALLLVAAGESGALAGWERLADSFAARVQYWQTSVRIALERPLLGVGPGSWADWYAQLMEPEFQETRAAHSAYVQIWAETGFVGLLLIVAFWASIFWRAASGTGQREAVSGPEQEQQGGPSRPFVLVAAPCLAAVGLALDYAAAGTLCPPPVLSPDRLTSHPLSPYLLVFAVWALCFFLLYGPLEPTEGPENHEADEAGARRGRYMVAGLAGGLGAFLVHSAGEFTLLTPAIGCGAATIGALLVLETGPPRLHRAPLSALAAMGVLALGVLLLAPWGLLVTPAALTYSRSEKTAESLRIAALKGELSPTTGRDRLRGRAVTCEFGRMCMAVPWEDEAWHRLGAWLIEWHGIGTEKEDLTMAEKALTRASELSPLHSAHWTVLGRLYGRVGDAALAAAAYHRAARLRPSLPENWYRFAVSAERAGILPGERCAALARATELIGRQRHDRNRVLGPPLELLHAWAELAEIPLRHALLDMWAERWHAAGREPAWKEAGLSDRLLFALRTGGVDADLLLRRPDSLIPLLWETAPPEARLTLLLRAAIDLRPGAGRLPAR
ncbi:MAG: O-antigen ligase family protein, partial [Candidatus Brocadiaceae bacterium]